MMQFFGGLALFALVALVFSGALGEYAPAWFIGAVGIVVWGIFCAVSSALTAQDEAEREKARREGRPEPSDGW